MQLALHVFADGVTTAAGNRVVFDLDRETAAFGAARVDGRALVWQLEQDGDADGALLSERVQLDPDVSWIVRCDRIDFPPGTVADAHTHPGPGIRYLLRGELEVAVDGRATSHEPGSAWFEAGPDPVVATASQQLETAFVRVLLLPAEWRGRRTIAYVDPANAGRPRLQRVTVHLEHPLTLPP
jgi:quercetin dioxygenase-like cupin family protein